MYAVYVNLQYVYMYVDDCYSTSITVYRWCDVLGKQWDTGLVCIHDPSCVDYMCNLPILVSGGAATLISLLVCYT